MQMRLRREERREEGMEGIPSFLVRSRFIRAESEEIDCFTGNAKGREKLGGSVSTFRGQKGNKKRADTAVKKGVRGSIQQAFEEETK